MKKYHWSWLLLRFNKFLWKPIWSRKTTNSYLCFFFFFFLHSCPVLIKLATCQSNGLYMWKWLLLVQDGQKVPSSTCDLLWMSLAVLNRKAHLRCHVCHVFCKSACSVLRRISQTSKWHIRRAQVRSTASGPKIVFLIHLKYKSRSHYALLHSSYLATPIHKMPYKAQCSIGLMCWDSVQRTFKGTQRKTAYHRFSSALWRCYTKKRTKTRFIFLGWANLKPLEIISSPYIKSHELPCVAFPLLVSLLSVRCSACCQRSSLRGPRLKLGLFTHLILNRSEGLLSRLSRAPRARRLSETAAFPTPDEENKTQWFMKLCFHGNGGFFKLAGGRLWDEAASCSYLSSLCHST